MTEPQCAPTSVIPLTDQEFNHLVRFVHGTYGIDLSRKRKLIEGRLSNTLKTKGLSSFTEYMKCMEQDKTGGEVHDFLNRITTNHSYFARENEHFDFLMQTALPYLEKTRSHDLRTWSAGCSAGQEAYNIAMVYDQYFGARKAGWDTTILATDISTRVLDKARQGIYQENALQGVSPVWKRRYFDSLPDGSYQVKEKLRREVVFKVFNLMDKFVYKKPFDVIFCRNVMIYFDAKTTNELVERFYDALSDGGYLFIGHSESVDRAHSRFTYLQPAVYQKLPQGRRR